MTKCILCVLAFLSSYTCMDQMVKTNEQHTILLKDFGTTCKSI